MRLLLLVLREARLHLLLLMRVPLAAFFTVAFPLMFLVMLNLLNQDQTLPSMGGIRYVQFFTPGIATFGLVTASYTNLAITTAMSRDNGVLKRVRGTPLPLGVWVAGRVLAATAVGLLSVALMVAVAMVAFDFVVLWGRVPAVILSLAVGAAAFSSLGLAVAGLARDAQSAPAVANATILPLAFVSGIFFPLSEAPGWVAAAARWLPLQPLASAVQAGFNPAVAPGPPWRELAVLALWTVLGMVGAVRTFSWEPRAPRQGRSRRG